MFVTYDVIKPLSSQINSVVSFTTKSLGLHAKLFWGLLLNL